MNWNSAGEFWAMGGYGLYVWGSYGVAALLVIGESLLARRGWKKAIKDVELDVEKDVEHEAAP